MSEIVHITHIPRCAGDPLMQLCAGEYGSEFIYARDASKVNFDKVKCVMTPTGFGALDKFGVTSREIVFLRDPVKRLISLYWYHQGKKKSALYFLAGKMTFLEFVDEQFYATLDNDQTRFLAGIKDCGLVEKEQTVDSAIYDVASQNLKRCAFVGLVEDFAIDVSRMAKELEWSKKYKLPDYTSEYPTCEINYQVISRVESTQVYDINLYRQVVLGYV